MSVEPLIINPGQPVGSSEGVSVSRNDRCRQFDEVLKEKVNYDKSLKEFKSEVNEIMTMAQIKLLRGLVSESEDQHEGMLSLFNLMGSVSGPSVSRSQMIDRYAATKKMSLAQDVQTERSEIESMIDRIGEKISLSPELIRSVVTAESDFRPDAVSPAGAQGLMQLMPETAREMGVEDSFNPQQNLLGGSRYLKQLLDKYDGDLDHALAAYNWGQGNVDRQGLGNMPEETRHYIARIRKDLERASA
jgi:hypothetical protein